MSNLPPAAASGDYTASDVLAPQFWTGRAERPPPGLDVACTKIAVDFQNLQRASADESIRRSLAILREAASADAAFSAFFDATGTHIESVMVAGGAFAQVHPEALRGVTLNRLPYLAARNEHLRMTEFRDTAAPRREQANDAGLLFRIVDGLSASGFLSDSQQAGRPARIGLRPAAHEFRCQPAAVAQAPGQQPGRGPGAGAPEFRWSGSRRAPSWASSPPTTDCGTLTWRRRKPIFLPAGASCSATTPWSCSAISTGERSCMPRIRSRVQNAIRDHVAGKTADVRKRPPHAAPER